MQAVILAAGRGSRLGDVTEDKPKLFLQVNGHTVYEYQRDALSGHVDDVSVVLGHGFESADRDEIRQTLALDDGSETGVEGVVLEDWREVENAASLERGLDHAVGEDPDEHVLVVCGDVLFSEDVLSTVVERFESEYSEEGYNAVGCIPGHQDDMTAVQYDDEGVITDYGAIEGHQEVGLFVLHRDHVEEAREMLSENTTDWFPVVFEQTPSKRVHVPADERWEINTPEHLEESESRVAGWQ